MCADQTGLFFGRFRPAACPWRLLLLAMVLTPSGDAGCLWAGEEPDEQPAATVTLTIDYGDGLQKRFIDIPWRPEMTLLDAMRHAQRHPRGIHFDIRGSGETAFLTRIDDLTNQGAGKKNWIYRVQGKLGDRSFAVYPLNAGDGALWHFRKGK